MANKIKSKRNTRNKKCKNKTKKRGGNCGCSGNNAKLFFNGGSPNLSLVPREAFYQYNSNLKNDPLLPQNIQSSRLMGDFSRNGGKRKNKKNKLNKKKGGSIAGYYNSFMNSGADNYIKSFAAINGANNQMKLLSGVGGISDTSVTKQPVLENPYGYSNPPLA